MLLKVHNNITRIDSQLIMVSVMEKHSLIQARVLDSSGKVISRVDPT